MTPKIMDPNDSKQHWNQEEDQNLKNLRKTVAAATKLYIKYHAKCIKNTL